MEREFKNILSKSSTAVSALDGNHPDIQRLKEIVRSHPDDGPAIAWKLLTANLIDCDWQQLAGKIFVCDILFQRSQKFRHYVLSDTDPLRNIFKKTIQQVRECHIQLARFVERMLKSWKMKCKSCPRSVLIIEDLICKAASSALLKDTHVLEYSEADRIHFHEQHLQERLASEYCRFKVWYSEFRILWEISLSQSDAIVPPEPEMANPEVQTRNGSSTDLEDLGIMSRDYEIEIPTPHVVLDLRQQNVRDLSQALAKLKTIYLPMLSDLSKKLTRLCPDHQQNLELLNAKIEMDQILGWMSNVAVKADSIIFTDVEDSDLEDVEI